MSVSVGGYDYNFIEDLPEDLTCTLCHFGFKNPVQIEKCGHIYCEDCYKQMKDHAENNCVDLLCPLDRQLIDVTRVFQDKFNERRVLNLMVKCQNFGDKCDWTGELREALDHEKDCCIKDTMLDSSFGVKFEQIMNRMTELESKVKCNEQKHVEKDNLIKNLNKQIVDQNKQIVNLGRQNENQDRQIGDQKKQIETLHQRQTKQQVSLPLSMIIPNVEDDSNYAPISTAFQWKFNPTEVESGGKIFSPPFYNVMNSLCFKLTADFRYNNSIFIGLCRYRGKHDHKVNEIKEMTNIDFRIHIFKKNGKLKTFKWGNKEDYSIPRNQMISKDWSETLNENEMESMTIDGYVHLHCFFNNIEC